MDITISLPKEKTGLMLNTLSEINDTCFVDVEKTKYSALITVWCYGYSLERFATEIINDLKFGNENFMFSLMADGTFIAVSDYKIFN